MQEIYNKLHLLLNLFTKNTDEQWTAHLSERRFFILKYKIENLYHLTNDRKFFLHKNHEIIESSLRHTSEKMYSSFFL